MDTEVDENGKQFLIQLFEQTKGDASVQVSMYDIGEQMGLDRDAASNSFAPTTGRLQTPRLIFDEVDNPGIVHA